MSFLTPFDSFSVLAVALPLAALVLAQRRAAGVRQILGVAAPGRRAWVPAALSLVLLAALVATAAAQPVVVQRHEVSERGDAQVFLVLDTSLSMAASSEPGRPTRLARAKRLGLRLERALHGVPVGIASMTDRSLPNLMPTTDAALFARTLDQSVAIDQPPPSQEYSSRATTFDALVPLEESHFFSDGVTRRLVVVLTDGEAAPLSPILRLTLPKHLHFLFVHVWADGERIYHGQGKAVPGYVADPTSTALLTQVARLTGGQVVAERDGGQLVQAAWREVGHGGTKTRVDAYARIALAPWFVLGGVAPLGFLLWRRNL
jgi:hypothetical protein